MITRISVSGFQSLTDISLDLGRFTVIYGESDVGKSALYRAFRAVFTSASGDDFLTFGGKSVSVSVEVDGKVIKWFKDKGRSPSYKLGDLVWSRVKGVPGDISSILGVKSVEISGDSFFPNLHGQFDPLFMLFSSPLKRSKVIGFLTSNILLHGIREANLERNRNEADIRSLEGMLEDLKKKLAVDWKSLSSECEKLKDAAKDIEALDLFHKRLSHVYSLHSLFSEFGGIEEGINGNLAVIKEFFARINRACEVYSGISDRHISLHFLSELVKVKDVPGLSERFFESFGTMVSVRNSMKSLYSEFTTVESQGMAYAEELARKEKAYKTAEEDFLSVKVECLKCGNVFPLGKAKVYR